MSGRKRGGPRYTLPDAWEVAIDGWHGWLRVSGHSANTIGLRRMHIRAIARWSGTNHPADVTLRDLVTLCSERRWSNEHRKGVRTSLVSFFDWCISAAIAKDNPAALLPTVRGDKPRPRPATEDIWQELISSAPPRELLMIRLAGEAGMRRGEVALCHRRDLLDDPCGACLIVHGKGNKQRVVPVTDDMAAAIRRHCPGNYVFPGNDNGHMSAHYVGILISRLMPAGYSMHTLRHRFATRAYRGSRNIRAVQMLLGHASMATTERYTAVHDDEIRAAMVAAVEE